MDDCTSTRMIREDGKRFRVRCDFEKGHHGRHRWHLHKLYCVIPPRTWGFWPWTRKETCTW